VADYAAALLAEMRKSGRVEVAPSSCDLALYQLGNNGLHAEIYQRALATPGVAVLHDAVLHHFLLGSLSEAAYLEEFVYNYGEWNRGLGQELWRSRGSSGTDRRYFDYPMLRRVVERSRAVVVHNPAAARVAREHAPGARIVEMPHLLVASGEGVAEAIRWRQRIGAGPDVFLFGVFGYLRESKRLMTILQVFGELHRSLPKIVLLVAGEFVSSDLERAAAPLLSAPGIIRLPHLPEREFRLAASAVDACINLRYPAAGETSGIAIRMMGAGKPVLVTESLECAQFPEGACMRISAGPAERDSLAEHMMALAAMPELAAAIGERAAAHVRAEHDIQKVAGLFWDLLRAV
jgi:glycosyltransferase involved in cell wall biosynthesis